MVCVLHITTDTEGSASGSLAVSRVVGSNPTEGSRCFIEQETYPHWLVLVGSRNGFDRDFTIALK